MYTSMAEDVQTIAHDLGLGSEIRFSRLAVTPAQITEFSLSTAPPETHGPAIVHRRDGPVRSESPDVLADIVRAAIEYRSDAAAYATVRHEEEEARKTLGASLRPLLLGSTSNPIVPGRAIAAMLAAQNFGGPD